MKVAHLTTVDSTLRFLLLPQLRAVVEAGGEAVGISSPGPWVEGLLPDGIRHVALTSSTRSMSPGSDLKAALQLWRVLRRERPDVLHTHNPKPGLYGRILGRLAGVPVIINTVHGLYATERDSIMKRSLIYGLEAIASRFSDLELVQSAEDLRLMTRWRISRPSQTRFLGNGVDLARFDPDRFPAGFRSTKRAELGIADKVIVVGIVARLVAEKGYPELLMAMQRLGAGYVLLAVGPEDPQKVDSFDLQSMVGDGVLFLGYRDDVEELYRAMDIFVLPSHREGFPRAAMEAASSGLPIVATDVRGCREVVDDGATGLLVPVLDPEALANAIASLGENPELRQTFGRQGRVKALAEFDEKQLVAKVISAYRAVARRKGLGGIWPGSGPQGAISVRETLPSDRHLLRRMHGRSPQNPTFFGPGTISLVAEDDAGPAGVISSEGEGAAAASMSELFVTPDARNGGVELLLLSSLLHRLGERGIDELVAETTDHATSALLQSAGFTAHGNGRYGLRTGHRPS